MTRCILLLGAMTTLLSAGPALAAEPSRAPEADAWALGCRLANYYEFQDEAWTHLPSIGLHYLFMPVPKPEELAAVQQRLASSGLKVAVMRGQADLSQPTSVEELAGHLAICE